jgi:hypothetical protein
VNAIALRTLGYALMLLLLAAYLIESFAWWVR